MKTENLGEKEGTMSEQEVFKRLQRIASEFGYRVTIYADYVNVMRDSRIQDGKSWANFTRSQHGYERAIAWLQAKAQRGEL